jgi:hypothetical protein
MAECLGLLVNLGSLIGTGLALSRTLYDFATVLNSASSDVKDLATDISLFCAVLKQVKAALTQARAYRLSLSAIQTTQDVIDCADIIFNDLQSQIAKLQKGDARLDFVARVKWYFKEKRVRLVHSRLQACCATLHV